MEIEIEEMIERIIQTGRVEDMHELSEILEDVIEELKAYDEECAKEYEMKIYIMANGEVLNRDMAEEIVNNMHPVGKRWTIEETEEIQHRYGEDNIRNIDFFVVMNSAYNDQKDLLGDDIEKYVKYTRNFIEDEDANDNKVFLYFTIIPRK